MSVITSLVYSSLFPFTVVVGGARGYAESQSSLTLHLSIACATILLYALDPSLDAIFLWLHIVATVDLRLYFPLLLYLGVFGAISETATTSFNFEENSLISQGVLHVLLYVSQLPAEKLSFFEVFLPAWTFGLMMAISPVTSFLQEIKATKNPIGPLAISGGIVLVLIGVGIRPWLVEVLGEDPLVWLVKYMLWLEGFRVRFLIVCWWVAVLAFGISVPVWFFTGSDGRDNGESLNKRRKFFHGIVVLLFIPSLCLDVLPSQAKLTDRVTLLPLQCLSQLPLFYYPK